VVDAAVLLAATIGSGADVLSRVGRSAVLVTTDRAVEEAQRRIEFGLKRPDLIPLLHALVEELTVEPVAPLSDRLPLGQDMLRDATPARNGSTSDAHLLLLAWAIEADIWTHDRDFAGTGVATWSTINLLRGLGQASGQS
jgi:predicted nucleic acid-binding protein